MRKFVLLLLLSALLPACGLKGPLYLPAQTPTANPSAPATSTGNAQPDDRKTPPAPAQSP